MSVAISPETAVNREVIISADSHVMEPPDLWSKALSSRFGDQAPSFPPHKVGEGFQHHPGGQNPHERVKEMAQDGVSAEVLYPTLGLGLFSLDDPALQEACFRVYNDWLLEYCQPALDRLVGIAAISVYNIDQALKELRRCRDGGLKGALIWEAPHPDLPFPSSHYEPLWAAAQDLDMPISLHILTGHGYVKNRPEGVERYRGSVNHKTTEAVNALFDFTHYGILDRYPELKLVMVEHEVGWLPYYVQQWDYYFRRFRKVNPLPINKAPGEYIARQVYCTFFNDPIGTKLLNWWGAENCMWSNDFPHENSTWPRSREVIARDLGSLPEATRARLVRDNVVRLYKMRVPEPV
jgi:predicted TIM-barrel fold metal-dependent hydrolase